MSERLALLATEPAHPSVAAWRQDAVTWLPLAGLSFTALVICPYVQPWLQMWALAVAIFAGFKWATWRHALAGGVRLAGRRSFFYLALWPGMDARGFLIGARPPVPSSQAWMWAITKTLFGATLLWGVARLAGEGLLAGWIAMVGILLLLHFGSFDLLAFSWRRFGIRAQPLMNAPIRSKSLGDFWGRRWNSAFQSLAFDLMFRPLSRRFGGRAGMMLTFVISGLIHDLVISLPSGGGYGFPTLYFAGQGVGLLVERSSLGARFGLGKSWRGRVFAFAVIVLPLGVLFSPRFVHRVILPFLHVIGAI